MLVQHRYRLGRQAYAIEVVRDEVGNSSELRVSNLWFTHWLIAWDVRAELARLIADCIGVA